MAQNRPTSNFEKTELSKSIQSAYKISGRELTHSSPDTIKEALLAHIAIINPELTQQMMTSPTEESVLAIVGRVEKIATSKAANDSEYNKNAPGEFLKAA